MESNRFDDLTRAMAGGRSRRQLIKGLAGGAVAAAVGGWRVDRAAGAQKVRVCHRTGSLTNPVVLIEVGDGAVADHVAHGDAINPDFQNDPANCGGCGKVCDDGNPCTVNTCVAGACAFPPVQCATCTVCAGGSCVPDPLQEGAICGDDGDTCTDDVCRTGVCTREIAVGRACDDEDACTGGDSCQSDGSCAGTALTCDVCNACSGGTCGPIATDARCATLCCNGTCCPGGHECLGGSCRPICLPSQAQCDPSNNQCCNGRCEDVPGTCGGQGVPQCCVSGGVRCDATCDCCRGNSCVGGICCANQTGMVCDEEQNPCCAGLQCLNGTCQSATCLHIGDICTPENNECCQDEPTQCRTSSGCGVGVRLPRCCHPIGGSCNADCDCCPGAECEFGVCKNALCLETTDVCQPGGKPCCGNAECRQGYFAVGVNQCCGLHGQPCSNLGLTNGPNESDVECCIVHGLTCGPSGTCEQCRAVGQSCTAGANGGELFGDHNCCLGAACVNGVCAQPSGCQPSGGRCQEDSVCCPGRACSNGQCVYVCSAEGEGCAFDDGTPNPLPCCGGLTCSGTFPNQRCAPA